MNKLVEQLSAHALAAWDTENHFRAIAAMGMYRRRWQRRIDWMRQMLRLISTEMVWSARGISASSS